MSAKWLQKKHGGLTSDIAGKEGGVVFFPVPPFTCLPSHIFLWATQHLVGCICAQYWRPEAWDRVHCLGGRPQMPLSVEATYRPSWDRKSCAAPHTLWSAKDARTVELRHREVTRNIWSGKKSGVESFPLSPFTCAQIYLGSGSTATSCMYMRTVFASRRLRSSSPSRGPPANATESRSSLPAELGQEESCSASPVFTWTTTAASSQEKIQTCLSDR